MKAFLLTLSLTLTLQSAISQDYIGLPESGGKWVNAFYSIEGIGQIPVPVSVLTEVVSYCTLGVDTIINNLNYSIIDTCDSGGYKGAFRNFEGKVFYVPKDSTAEYILYDYSLTPGDTVFNVYYEGFFGGPFVDPFMVCSNVDSMFINGNYRKTVSTYSPYGGANDWIEGIGQVAALFKESWVNVSQYSHVTHCMSQDGIVIYPDFFEGACELYLSTEESADKIREISIYPNPSNSVFYVFTADGSEPLTIGQFRVYDTSGRLMNVIPEKEGSRVKINLQEFSDGMYWIQIELNGQYVGKRIVKI